MNKKRTIYMSGTLMKLAEKTLGGGFSRRLNAIVERYQMLIDLELIPDFSDAEFNILGEILKNMPIDARKVRGLHLDVLDVESGTVRERQILSQKIETLTVGQRLALIEKVLGQE